LKEILETLREGRVEEKIEVVRQLSGTLDRRCLAAISEYAYFSEIPRLRRAAEESLRESSHNYLSQLSSYFYVIPWDRANISDEGEFKRLYDQVSSETNEFTDISEEKIKKILEKEPKTIVVFRVIAGYTLNEVSFILHLKYGANFPREQLQSLERNGLEALSSTLKMWKRNLAPIAALFYQSVDPTFLKAPTGIDSTKFRLLTDKFDTREGWGGVAKAAREAVPYYELLYQRYIGGPFRQARDTSSSLKAEILEGPIENLLRANGIPYYKTGLREKIEGWDQAPDFLIPGKEAPQVIIEAKIAEDGGTARDKAARIKVLAGIARPKGIDLISVIDGKGFTRINDVLLPIIAYSGGFVFSYSNKEEILEVPSIKRFIKATSLKTSQ